MAAVHSRRPALPTSSSSAQRQSKAPDLPKLRNSCHTCASSKLKCSQDKPTCARCAKRGLKCEYVAAKQGGRKPNKRSSSDNRSHDVPTPAMNTDEDMHLSPQANWFTSASLNPSIDFLRSPGIMHHSPKPSLSGSSDTLTDLFGPMDQTLSSSSTVAGNDLEDLFNSPMQFCTETSDFNPFKTADFFPTGIENNSNGLESLSDAYPVFENSVSELLALSAPTSAPNLSTTRSKEVREYQENRATEPPCSCLVQALGFMKQLFPTPSSTDCMTWATQGFDKATATPTNQATIARNEATIEAVGAMLNCPSCSQDGYLLAVMSLIIFRVLGWYAAVARQTPGLQGSPVCCSRQPSPPGPGLETPIVVGSYRLDGTDSPRMAAQLVLSELHRVRRLVDQLSSKLKMQAAKNGRGGAETPDSKDLDNEMTLPLSSMMYDQLDADLRKRLKALSFELIDRLKRL